MIHRGTIDLVKSHINTVVIVFGTDEDGNLERDGGSSPIFEPTHEFHDVIEEESLSSTN
jgi:hypothetical protein